MVTKLAVDYGYDGITIAIVKEQLKTKPKEQLVNEIMVKKIISKDLKLKIKDYMERANTM